ncbi:MAG: (2Fe-2S)-binding protein [Phycisphaerae bacterium]|nr:(2Fe-2S)-binding protein [Phycisphaerae bacterium]
MPQVTINGKAFDFTPGQMILDVANANGVAIPQYCYHPGLSIVASCRICLAECWAPNPRNNNKLESMGKLLPTCQTACSDGMVVYTDSPKAVANQKAVMEYLLINHPLDCPVCDQAGECTLQDYSYEYGRGQSRFEEIKVKQPKKDVGPHVLLYSDRCIMCTRCVRFTREVSGTAELCVAGRGNREEIDVFPGQPLANELSANVVDLCPVGALLDKDFLFAQRVWFLKSTPSIDGITASGDNILIEHNDGKVYRIKPRTNMAVNKWWITDEVRYGWKFIHREDRLASPVRRQFGTPVPTDFERACREAVGGLRGVVEKGGRVALMVSPMLTCEEAFTLAQAARALDPQATLAVGPIPVHGQDKTFPPGKPDGFRVYAEKCPNARGVRRVLEAVAGGGGGGGSPVLDYAGLLAALRSGSIGGVIATGNYPSEWATPDLAAALAGRYVVLIDTLPGLLTAQADIVLPGATWAEKAGTFENARGMLQAFEQAIPARDGCRQEGQIALDLLAETRPPMLTGIGGDETPSEHFNAADTRRRMAVQVPALACFSTDVAVPTTHVRQEADMQMVEL